MVLLYLLNLDHNINRMKKHLSYLLVPALICAGAAFPSSEISARQLEGFAYGTQDSPDGTEWQDPLQLSLNKEQPHAWFFSFGDKESASKVLPQNSSLWMSLDGTWKFNWVGNPSERPVKFYENNYDTSTWDDIKVPSSWNIEGIGKDGSMKYGVPIYVNVGQIFYWEIRKDDWRNGVMRTPPADWTVYRDRNEVGSYKRTFTVPEEWDDKEIFINFDGVDSFFYLWINGQYVGFSKNSRNVASFNITSHLVKGENQVAVEVYRTSDGSMLEAQDMFRLPGIFRTVALEAKPKVCVRDLRITPSFTDESRKDGILAIELDAAGAPEGSTVSYTLYKNRLFSDELEGVVATFEEENLCARLVVKDVSPWSAEAPWRYTLVGELKDPSGKTLDIFSSNTGFRDVQISFCKAEDDEFGLQGTYFFVNGKTVKLKGVNRHESHPEVGHAVTPEMMQEDLFLMKRANINHVRNCHYPDAPLWYQLCDKYGIYLMDEANIESHHYHYGEASLSHPEEWKAAHVARMTEMMRQNYNHPSIIIWSMGNEAGPGQNFKATYDAAKQIDSIRPVQYERNNFISDLGCSQYPSIEWVRRAVKGEEVIKYPYHVNEYSHSMGNAMGNFEDYWAAFESSNFIMGGAIWDWVDQSMYYYTPDGTRFLAYGGDFDEKPNDGEFEMNGMLFGDREPKPQYYEVKKVHQYVRTSYNGGKVEVFNKNYFEKASYDLLWTLAAEGETIKSGKIEVREIDPRSACTYSVSLPSLPSGKECTILFEYALCNDFPWARKGFVVAQDQFIIQNGANSIDCFGSGGKIKIDGNIIKGKGFEAEFDFAKGTIGKLSYGKQVVIPEGCGPVLHPMRAFVNNDNWIYEKWFYNGLHNLEFNASEPVIEKSASSIKIIQNVTAQAPNAYAVKGGWSSGRTSLESIPEGHDVIMFTMEQSWTFFSDGHIQFTSDITSDNPDLVLPRLGYRMKLSKEFDNLQYYGRGPWENYIDRCAGSMLGIWGGKVAGQVTHYTRPQEMGNHEGVRWLSLTSSDGKGLKICAEQNSCCEDGTPSVSMSALPYSAMDLVYSPHQYELPQSEYIWLQIDAKVTGLGGNSCGQGGPLSEDQTFANGVRLGFSISYVN